MNPLLRRVIVGAVIASSGVVAGASPSLDATVPTDAWRTFDERIAEYAALRQRAVAALPPLAPSADVQWIQQGRTNLSFAITAAMPHARQGDIFTPTVAVAFRRIIREALTGVDAAAVLRDLYEDCEMPIGYRPLVHAGYPDWAIHEIPIALLDALPSLPEGIMYRLIGLDLLIWDVDADLIVDVLPDALPSAGS